MAFAPHPVTTDDLITFLTEKHGVEVGTQELLGASDHFKCSYATVKKRLKNFKKGIGKWNLTVQQVRKQLEHTVTLDAQQDKQSLIPSIDNNFVPFGNFRDLKKILKSDLFYPIFITGLSGNGKTFGVEQACAQLNRELIRVNITIETDEDDLVGGFSLLMGILHGIMVPSSKHLSVDLYSCSTRSTLQVTKFSACSPF